MAERRCISPGGQTESRRRLCASYFREGQWEPPQPVAELGSPADDMGPILSRDGRELYFFSNRPGGRGGYDLYVSTRKNGKWSKPQNLGPQINTPANEYDPCLDPSGTVLYFASNRTEPHGPPGFRRKRRRKTANGPAPCGRKRDSELMIFIGSNETTETAKWSDAKPVAELNLPDSNEGAPHVSPDGAFLYFASDRPARSGEEANLDLYRVRLSEGQILGEAENLGPGINTQGPRNRAVAVARRISAGVRQQSRRDRSALRQHGDRGLRALFAGCIPAQGARQSLAVGGDLLRACY